MSPDRPAPEQRTSAALSGPYPRWPANDPAQVPVQETAGTGDLLEVIRRLGELHDQGVLTDEEFQREKAELLGRL